MKELGRITPEKLLAAMTPGVAYSANDLAKKLGKLTHLVRTQLVKQEALGTITTARRRDQTKLYSIAGVPVVEEKKQTATPLIPHLMTGELVGYDATIERRRALCMSLRRAS